MRLKNVMQIRRGGKVHTYFRRIIDGKAQLTRLPDAPHDSAEFLAAYAKAKGTPAPAMPGALDATMRSAQASARFSKLSPAYRAGLSREFAAIAQIGGQFQIAQILQKHIAADVEKASAPDLRLKAWRFLGDHAVALGHWPDNRAAAVKPVRKGKVQGHAPWSPDDIDRFRARWSIGTAPRAAMELLHWTGARISDAVQIGPGMVDRDGVLTYRQAKTGGAAHCPWSCALPDYAASMAADRDQMHRALDAFGGQMVFLPTLDGNRRSSKALGTMLRDAAKSAGIDKTAHGLRKARAVALAEAGATTHEIAAWTGHESLKEVDHYTKAASRRRAVMGANANTRDQTANTPKK